MSDKLDFKKDFLFVFFNIIFPILVFCFWDIFFKVATMLTVEDARVVTAQVNLMSIVFGFILYMILLSFFRNNSTSTKIAYIFSFILYIINQIRIIYTEEPITIFDIKFIENIKDLLDLVKGTYILKIVISLIIYCIGMISFYFILKKSEKYQYEIKNKIVRIALFIFGIIMICILGFQNKYTKSFYLKNFYSFNELQDYNIYTSNLGYYLAHGVSAGFYGVYLNSLFYEPDDYDDNELTKLVSAIEKEDNSYGNPNIIIVFSESFWDISKIDEVEFDNPITENFNTLKNEGKVIELLSPTFGGLSENVAFEMLTGGNNTFFPNGYIPMMSLFDINSDCISIVKELKNNGYYSKIVFGKDYYNTEKTCLKLGFDEYEEIEETDTNLKGLYISDEYITNKVISYFESKEKSQKTLYMVETIENHMPYNEEKFEDYTYDINITKSNLKKEENESILAYAQGIYDADKQLKVLYDYIQDYEEPTIIIFLGDHLPRLSTKKGDFILNKFNYFQNDNNIINTYNYYNTQALILSNYNINLDELPEFMGTDFLLTSIINKMDVKLSNYYLWLNSIYSEYPAMNRFISLDKNKNLYYTNYNTTEKMRKLYEIRDKIQYKFFLKQ